MVFIVRNSVNDMSEKREFELYFGNYCLFRVVKRGSIATVYRGEHMHMGNPVIVKVLNSWSATPEHIKQFCTEARLHASLRHPNIIRILDFGIRGRLPFIVMDYASRGTLQEYFPAHVPLSPTTILPFVQHIGSGLQYIHNHNLIHRDIKPQNIFLGAAHEVWLGDFGITIALQPWSQRQRLQSIGTAQYAAPEQIEGRPLTASDQYALAVQMYIWLCGRPPFYGTSMQLCHQHLYNEPQSLRAFVPALPLQVEQVILRALAKDPYQRFACVQDFVYAFKAAVQECYTETSVAITTAVAADL